MPRVELIYGIPNQTFDNVSNLFLKLRYVGSKVNQLFPESFLLCSVGGNDFMSDREVSVVIKDIFPFQEEYQLEQAVVVYVAEAGLPDFVANGSDYDVCEIVLAPFGKTLRRKIWGGLFWKTVVDV